MTETFSTPETPPAIFGNNGPLHPNRISAGGVLLPVAGMGVEIALGASGVPAHGTAALGGLAAGGGADFADGRVARKWPKHLKSKEGARIDPLSDKVRNILIFIYLLSVAGITPQVILGYITNIGVDLISTLQRGSIIKQVREALRAIYNPASCEIDDSEESSDRAPKAGKYKTFLQTVAGGALVGENIFREKVLPYAGIEIDSSVYQNITATTLGVAAVLGAVGIYQKGKIKKQLAQA